MTPDEMLNDAARRVLDGLHADMRAIFGHRLRSIVAYGPGTEAGDQVAGGAAPRADGPSLLHSLVLADGVGYRDLQASAAKTRDWSKLGLATPLLLSGDEFARSLDAFPLEYGDILARHVVVAGEDPFGGLRVRPEDLRRACEVQAKGHLIHLREGFIETGGDAEALARLIVASAPSFATLLANVARLQGDRATTPRELAAWVQAGLAIPAAIVERVVSIGQPADLGAVEALDLYPAYLDAVERLWRFVDGWGIEPRGV